MTHGLDAAVASPPFSLLLSWLLFLGCFGLGRAIQRIPSISRALVGAGAPGWQSPIIGIAALLLILHPLALLGVASRSLLRPAAIGLALFGLFTLAGFLRRFRPSAIPQYFKSLSSSDRALALLTASLIVAMALLASAPITNADSLRHHTGAALHILETGAMPTSLEWFHGRLAGSGEVLEALGLASGAEQFGSLVQFAGLLAVLGLLAGRLFLTVAALSPPVLVFLVSSTKPQLCFVGMTTLAFTLAVADPPENESKKTALVRFGIICLLAMIAVQGKFSFLLGAGIVGIMGAASLVRRKLLSQAAAVAAGCALATFGPALAWKSAAYGTGILQAFLHPVPAHLPGYAAFEAFLRTYADNDGFFPLRLLVPSGLNSLTMTIGLGLLLFFVARPRGNPLLLRTLGACAVFFAAGLTIGLASSRYFLEPYFWLLAGLALASPSSLQRDAHPPSPVFKAGSAAIRWAVVAQAIFTLGLTGFGAATLFPGSLAPGLRTAVMTRAANGHELMRWADSVLPRDAVLLTQNQSMALSPRRPVSMEWIPYVDPRSPEADFYFEATRARKPTHLLVHGDRPNPGVFAPWVEGVFAETDDAGHETARNPFRRGARYGARIFTLNPDLPYRIAE